MSNDDSADGRRNNRPPKDTRFKPGQSGNPAGRPRKRKKTFEDELNVVFGKERKLTIDGKKVTLSTRQLILEQIARGAAQGNPKMIKLSLPFLKVMDDTPEFEVLPADKEVLKHFLKTFSEDGSKNDE